MTINRVLVTGGAGFIGSHTVDLLLRSGKQVAVLDNLSCGRIENLPLDNPNLEFIEGDVLEYPLVQDLLLGCDAVLHLAAIASVPQSIEVPIYTFQVNTQGFLHILEAVRTANRPIRLVHASSAAVYGNACDLPCRDDVPLAAKALSPYALQKAENERYADLYFALHGVSSLALRYFNVYGPKQDPASPYSGVISRFLDGYRQAQKLAVYGDGLQTRDFIHVSDVARANLLALEGKCNGVLNVATGQAETLLNIIHYLEAAGTNPLRYDLKPPRVGDIRASYAATQLAEKELGFKFTVNLQEGIQKMVENAA